jgi:23S rRNA pseudouridine2457 synthase
MENIKNQSHRNFILFKSYGYLSQFVNNQTKRTNKKLLNELYNFPENTMAIGRLDEASEGLLLLTTNGKTSQFIRSNKVEKQYLAQVDGIITNEAIELLKNGVEISTETGKYLTKKCAVQKLNEIPKLPERAKKIRDERHGPTSWVSITLTEGKFRQVRKMTAVVGFPTLRLVRIRIGNIHINNMKAGEVIEIAHFFDL